MLRIDSLRKAFGEVQALDGVSLTVRPGEVFGFLGANGAGKTTTMRIVLGFLRADAGTVTWKDRGADLAATGLGIHARGTRTLPANAGHRPARLLRVAVRHAATAGAGKEALDWLARFRIAEYADRKAESLSKGNQQKVQYIATILHDPDVLLMDEPFAGLDPVNVAMLKAAFIEMRDRGKTILFSTHQLDQAEELCDSVAIIDHGRVITAGTTREVKRSTGHQVIRVATAGDGERHWLLSLPHVTVTRPGQRLHGAAGRRRGGSPGGPPGGAGPRRRPPLRGRRPVARGGLRREGRRARRRGADAGGSRGGRSMSNVANIFTVARREYAVRVRTRSFIFGTVLLVLGRRRHRLPAGDHPLPRPDRQRGGRRLRRGARPADRPGRSP